MNLQAKRSTGGIITEFKKFDNNLDTLVYPSYSDESIFNSKTELLICHDGVKKVNCLVKNLHVFFDVYGPTARILDINHGMFGMFFSF